MLDKEKIVSLMDWFNTMLAEFITEHPYVSIAIIYCWLGYNIKGLIDKRK